MDIEQKMQKFREKHFKEKPMPRPNDLQPITERLAEINPALNKLSDNYFATKIMGEMIPFIEGKLAAITRDIMQKSLIEQDREKQKLVKLFDKFASITETQEEKKALLGSDYVSESENEDDYKQAFSTDELRLIKKHKINLLRVLRNQSSVKKSKARILANYPKLNLMDYL